MLKKIFFVSLFCALSGISIFAQNKSVYTDLKTEKCKTISQSDADAGSYEGECAGTGGYKLRVLEGDLRQTINVISPAKKKFELGFWSFFGGFSSVGEKAEWRVKGKSPVALIVRFTVADAEDSTKNTAYLMVSKISAKSSCVVGVVNPGANQNEEARKMADSAASKPCKSN